MRYMLIYKSNDAGDFGEGWGLTTAHSPEDACTQYFGSADSYRDETISVVEWPPPGLTHVKAEARFHAEES